MYNWIPFLKQAQHCKSTILQLKKHKDKKSNIKYIFNLLSSEWEGLSASETFYRWHLIDFHLAKAKLQKLLSFHSVKHWGHVPTFSSGRGENSDGGCVAGKRRWMCVSRIHCKKCFLHQSHVETRVHSWCWVDMTAIVKTQDLNVREIARQAGCWSTHKHVKDCLSGQ